jgi:2-methylcitrate dehydratase PrpD
LTLFPILRPGAAGSRQKSIIAATQPIPPGCALELARGVDALNFDLLDAEVVSHARHLLLDLLGAALAGVDTAEAQAAVRAANVLSAEGGRCTIWGTVSRATPGIAALVNGITAHARELDDFGGVDHSGAVVVPALLAAAEGFPVISGRTLLTALVAGYETGRRVLDSVGGYRPHNHNDGFHSTGSCGSFAAAAAVAKALALDVREIAWALGLAGSFTGGTWAFNADGAMSKRYHAGRAAETGITVACLARSGFSGPLQIFEAEWGGFWRCYGRSGADPEALLAGEFDGRALLRSGVKPYAACRDIHSTLDVVLAARRQGLAAAEVVAVEIDCIPEMYQMVGNKSSPASRLEAQLSLAYSVAVALHCGRAFLGEYEAPLLTDSEVKRLAALVSVRPDSTLPFDAEPLVAIHTADGRVLRGHVPHASGAWQNPLPAEAIVEKFTTLATRALSAGRVEELRGMVLAVDDLEDVRQLCRLLRS